MVRNPTIRRCPRQAQNPPGTRRWPLRLSPMDWKKLAWVAAPALALMVIALLLLNRLVEPLPPRRITISTGREGGAYYMFAKEYARLAAKDGFTVEIQTGAGSVETLKRLMAGQAMAGFVQGGTAEAVPSEGLRSLGSLYYEPVWLFHRKTRLLRGLNDLRGLRIQVGEEGSGIRPLAVKLLRDSGVTAQNSTLLALTSEGAAAALEAGRIDAAFFIMAPSVPLVRRLLLSPTVSLWSVRRTIAYTTHYRFLSTITLGEGVVDLVADVPDHDIILPALYNSQMRKRVTRWYREVNEIDHVLATGTPEEAKAAAERLREVQAKLAQIPPPPPGLMGELYDLKQHVEWLLRQADTQAAARHSPR